MISRPNICVIVVTYNHERYISKCLESILSQSLQPKTIKIFDDCSVDNTFKIVKKIAKKYPDKFVLHRNDKNLGLIKNMALAYDSVDGEYCALVAGDDYWGTEKLSGEYKALMESPEAGAAYSNVAMIDENDGNIFLFHDPASGPMRSGKLFYYVATRKIFSQTGNCFRNYLFRTNFFRSLGWNLEESMSSMEDYNLNLLFSFRYPFVASAILKPMVYYRRHAGGASFDRKAVHVASMMIYEKYDHLFKELPKEQELACRIFQETQLSYMIEDFSNEKRSYYSPSKVYDRILKLISELPEEGIDAVWRSNIVYFRKLTVAIVADLLRNNRDMDALASWLRFYRNELHPIDGWFALTPEIFSRLKSAHQKFLVDKSKRCNNL